MRRLLLPLLLVGTWSLYAQEGSAEKAGAKAGEHAENAEQNEMPNEIWWNRPFLITAHGQYRSHCLKDFHVLYSFL